LGRRSRRREHADAARPAPSRRTAARAEPRTREPDPQTADAASAPSRPSRSEAKNAAARGSLKPLGAGERPRAITVAAVVAAALGVANIVAWLAGTKIGHRRPAAPGVFSYSLLMGVAAWGMWRSRYWAVLGMQALLGILMLIFSVLVLTASNVLTVVISIAVIAPAGALFWFLIKAMARIQMPERRRR
jgi:hypothetical protein